jgi:hypothetical protein
MSITAIVEKDTIKLPEGVHWPDGTQVHIEPVMPIPTTKAKRQKLTATPEMIALRKAALDEVRKLNPYREIDDPAAWQKEIRADRPLPFRD